MKNQTALFLVLAFVLFISAGTASAYNRSRTTKGTITKGKPAVAFTGTVKEIITNSLPYQIVVDGASNSDSKDAPKKGSVTFDVQGSCHIKASGGSSGNFSDIKVGERIGISYSGGRDGGKYQAHSIDLDPKADTSTKDTAAKKK